MDVKSECLKLEDCGEKFKNNAYSYQAKVKYKNIKTVIPPNVGKDANFSYIAGSNTKLPFWKSSAVSYETKHANTK